VTDWQPTGKQLINKIYGLSWRFAMLALFVVCAVLESLLELTREQWVDLSVAVLVYIVPATFFQQWLQRRTMGRVPDYCDARHAGTVASGLCREAFAAVIDLPRRSAILAIGGWLVPVFVMSLYMDFRWEYFGLSQYLSVWLAGLVAGVVASMFTMYQLKRLLAPIRRMLAEEISDPQERAQLIHSLSLGTKLVTGVVGIAVIPVVFAVLFFQAEAGRTLEAFVVDWEHKLLEATGDQLDQTVDLERVMGDAPGLAAQVRITLLDLSEGAESPLEEFVMAFLRRQIEQLDREAGDSLSVPSGRYFAWRRHGDSVLLASMPSDVVHVDQTRMGFAFAAVLVITLLAAYWLARMMAGDVSEATSWLQAEAARMASGDLRKGRVFESEDELGSLARSFETMAHSLRAAVGSMARTADRVEVTSVEMVQVAQAVSGVTSDQVQGIEQTSALMEQINGQVRGIANSAQALNVSVEESSSSILELGAAGEELNETATVLNEKVNEVSSSIEQMARSVKHVSENTEGLAEAADETSASMGEMATSMREVDVSAEETARLSRLVVDAAESGQVKMVQTIGGMDAIREATETAEQVIRSLGSRASEIGAIVDVIDDVADETNLLALNAAIIAAQAGDQGRAFSVVADEIKDLADRVRVSTNEIGSLIRAVQDESENAIGAIEEGSQSVAYGVDLAAAAGSSLEEITRASRESGQRIAGIVSAVCEQAKAANHVVELMESVRGGVEEIRMASLEQDRGNEVVYRSSVAMKDVAQQMRSTTEEQARGSGRIRESAESVREAVEQINGALQEQTAACRSAVEFLEAMHARTETNEDAVKRLDRVAEDLIRQAEQLREDVQSFQI